MQPASKRRSLGGRWTGPALLVLIPALLGAGVWALKARPTPGAGRPGMTVAETWPTGGPKVLAREWSDAGAAFEEYCFYDPKGAELGCGTRRNGDPWDGTFIEWEYDRLARTPGGDHVIKHIATWKEGRRHGLWRSFNPDGTPSVELHYDNDVLKDRKIVNSWGNVHQLELPPGPSPAELPTNRRPVKR